MREYRVYKLSNPKEQVGYPNNHKWAVGEKTQGFVDAFTTKRAAQHLIDTLLQSEKTFGTNSP